MFEYRNKDWLHQKYFIERLSLRAIGRLCNVSHECVRKWLLKYGLFKGSAELLKKEIEEFDRLVNENRDFILTVLCKGEDKEFWQKIIHAVGLDRERKLNLPEPKQTVGRVARNRQTHPGDHAELSGGEPVSSKYYDAKCEGKTHTQEMDELQEIANKVTS